MLLDKTRGFVSSLILVEDEVLNKMIQWFNCMVTYN